jgi:hypothetical protein
MHRNRKQNALEVRGGGGGGALFYPADPRDRGPDTAWEPPGTRH